ncbi:MAG: helix-turn-helix domain-containing protein, partial [Candidatus Aminicenantes bacterium]|nr:helix-turn-helix domain-containing protein [Candidatus Aminicenantes bacterium]
KGLSMIDPAHVKINEYPPKTFLESVVIGGAYYSPQQKIIIPRGVKNVTFHFNALSLTAPEKVKFSYKLEEYDDDWNHITDSAERNVHYARLAPGFYRFRLKASNNDDVWSGEEVVYEFQLRPHFYQTFWFYALCSLLTVLIGSGLWQMYRLKLRIRELNKYKSSSLQDGRAEDYVKKLILSMEEKKYFTDQNIDLRKLADLLSIPPSHLSQIINVQLKQNFSDFIKFYRIEEAKKKLVDPEYQHFKLAAIGGAVGFKSISAFYSAFKKHTGMTPLDFKNKYKD